MERTPSTTPVADVLTANEHMLSISVSIEKGEAVSQNTEIIDCKHENAAVKFDEMKPIEACADCGERVRVQR